MTIGLGNDHCLLIEELAGYRVELVSVDAIEPAAMLITSPDGYSHVVVPTVEPPRRTDAVEHLRAIYSNPANQRKIEENRKGKP